MGVFGWSLVRTDELETLRAQKPYLEAVLEAVVPIIKARFGKYDKSCLLKVVGEDAATGGLGYSDRVECGKFLRELIEQRLAQHPTLGHHFRLMTVTEPLVDYVRRPPLTLIDTAQLIATTAYRLGNPQLVV